MKEEEAVLVAVAIDEVQARVYRKLLEDNGIRVLLADFDDIVIGEDVILGKTISNVKIIAEEKDAEMAKQIIQEHESDKITRRTSKSGEHVIFRCPHCLKYIRFTSKDSGSSQFCTECKRIVHVPY
jgi:hypothetical protein